MKLSERMGGERSRESGVVLFEAEAIMRRIRGYAKFAMRRCLSILDGEESR